MAHRRSFDEECRKFQYEADLENVKVNASERSLRGVVTEDMYNGKMSNEQIKVKEQQWTKTDFKLINYLLSKSEGSKAFVDQMFGDRKSISEQGTKIEPEPFSYALQVLHTDKDVVIELLSEPDCLLEKCIKNSCTYRTEKEISSSRVSNVKRKTFSVREIKKLLKHTFGGTRKEANQFSKCGKLSQNRTNFGDDCVHRGVETRNDLSSPTSVKAKGKLGKKQGVKMERELDIAREPDAARKKIDFSSGRFSRKYEVDAVLEANRLISARLIDSNAIGTASERFHRGEHDFSPVKPRKDSQYWSVSGQMRFSSCKTNAGVTSCDDGHKEYDTMDSATRYTKSNDRPKMKETNSINNTVQSSLKSELHEDDIMLCSTLVDDSDETFTNTGDDAPSTPTSISHLPESSKYQEEHESPVSVLDQFFAEDVNSPSSNMFQTARDPLKPQRLLFEECSFEPSPQDEQDYISRCVHLVFQASSLNWDQLSELKPQPDDELLHPSLFEQVEFRLPDSRVDSRLMFDRMNEVLLEIQQSQFMCPPCSSATVQRRICCVPLEQVVAGELMREADLNLLPRTQTTILDQLVAKDMADSRLWLQLWPQTENIMSHISDDILEETILDVILGFYS